MLPLEKAPEQSSSGPDEDRTSTSATNTLDPSDPEACQTSQPHPRDGISTLRWISVLVGLFLGALLYGLDTTIAADVQGPIYEDLGDIENLSWIGLGFPMASVAVILLLGRLYGLFDIKPLILSSIVIFEVGSALCGAAPTSASLIIGRVIAGVGGAGMYLGSLTYVAVFATDKEASLYNALIGLSWGVGAILGPVVGGAFSDSSASWRWSFYINLPLAGLLSPVYVFMFPGFDPRKDLRFFEKLRQVDWVGAVLNAAVFTIFMIVVSFSGSRYPWGSGTSIALWVVWGLSLIGFIVQQGMCLFTTTDLRIFPVHFLRKPLLILLYIVTATASFSNAVVLYYVPLFFQFTQGDGALKAAIRLLPYIVVFIFFVMLAGGLLPVLRRYNIFYIAGGILSTAGGAALFTIDENTAASKIYGYEVLMGAGLGLMFQTAYTAAATMVIAKDRPNSIGFINVAQIGTVAIALAISGCLFQNLGFNSLKDGYEGYGFPDDYIRSGLAGTLSPIFASANPEVIQIAVHAVASTIQRIFGTVIAAGAVTVICSLLMPWGQIDLAALASH
ncbi:major facilitator superfamily domain-containing protein [Dactylonectria macrodidyma]|uniref:Major facilitator superfamily domain-containing protein n=1 Tax=Dactylonectria macrodidyma TaxID=307937 RepID=A0A9P9E5A1_9HYPO|nr:major facilitator superfamily domain-containing protein [Dactylonectria macrodidyma]